MLRNRKRLGTTGLGAMPDDLSEINFSKKYNPAFGLHTSVMGYRYEHEEVDGDGPFLF